MERKFGLMHFMGDIPLGTTKEEFIEHHFEARRAYGVLVKAYKTARPQGLVGRIAEASSSAIINPDDIDVLMIGKYGEHSFAGSLIYVGTGEKMDVVLEGEGIEENHAEFQFRNGMCGIVNNSKIGLSVKGSKLLKGKRRVLESQTQIRFGPRAKYEFYSPEGFWIYVLDRAERFTEEMRGG